MEVFDPSQPYDVLEEILSDFVQRRYIASGASKKAQEIARAEMDAYRQATAVAVKHLLTKQRITYFDKLAAETDLLPTVATYDVSRKLADFQTA